MRRQPLLYGEREIEETILVAIAEDLAEAVVAGGMIEATPRG